MSKVIEFLPGFLVHDFPVHTHKYYEIHYIYKGRGVMTAPDARYSIKPHRLIIIPPGEEHSVRIEEPMGFHIIRIHNPWGEKGFIDNLCDQCRRQEGFLLTPARMFEMKRLMVLAKMETPQAQKTVWHGVMGLLSQLLIPEDLKTRSNTDDTMIQVLHFMDQNLNTRITLEALAARVNLTPSRLSHLFKERTGRSPIDYFLRLKVDAACYMLESSDYINKEMADHLGFSDEYHFSKVFKKKTGISPREYRNKIRREAYEQV